jgi:hypothetical protein
MLVVKKTSLIFFLIKKAFAWLKKLRFYYEMAFFIFKSLTRPLNIKAWTGRDLNPRPLACEASITTSLNYQPSDFTRCSPNIKHPEYGISILWYPTIYLGLDAELL